MNPPTQRQLLTLIFGLLFASPAMAQTGAELLLKPWPQDRKIEVQGDATFLDSGHTRDGGNFRLSQYATTGRARLPLDFLIPAKAEPRFGFDVKYWDIDATDSPLPEQLTDSSVGIGFGVLDESGWVGGLSIGVGYAGAGAFDDGNGYYGKADFAVGKTFADGSALGFVVDYDGNRTFLPDIPLPGFAYSRKLVEVDPSLLLTVGFPYTSIEWKPTEQFRLFLQYSIPDDLKAQVEYTPIKALGFFAEYDARNDAFHFDDLPNSHDRLLFQQRRAEVGIRWNALEQASFVGAAGYAFGQEFNVGWDTRDQERFEKVSDEPYLRVGFELRF